MTLCVDKKVLKVDNELQRNIDVEGLLNNHTRYYDNMGEALQDGYIPLVFSISIRSMYDNTVVAIIDDEGTPIIPIINEEVSAEYIHKGYDLVMFMSSIGVMQTVNYEQGFDELMTKHSQFKFMGMFYSGVFCPRIYSHIIMSDEGMKEFERYLKEGYSIVPIKESYNAGAVFKTLVKTLVIVNRKSGDLSE